MHDATWVWKPETLAVDNELSRALGLSFGASREDWLALALAGLWDSAPIGKAWDGALVGVQPLKAQPLGSAPICLMHPKHSETSLLADEWRDFLAAYLASFLWMRGAGPWEAVRGRPDREWDELARRCDSGLEGTQRVRGALADRSVKIGVARLPESKGDFRIALGDMLMRTCVAPARLAFHAFVGQFLVTRVFGAEPADEMGPWRPLADLMSIAYLPQGEWKQRAVLRVLRLPWSQSGAWHAMSHSWGAWGSAASDLGGFHRVALALQDEVQTGRLVRADHPESEPLITATMAYLAAGEHKYDGQAHVDAAAVLADRGDWEGSLSALRTAGFWQRRRFRATPVETLVAFVQGTAEAGPDYAAMHEVAQRHLDILLDELERPKGSS